MIIIFNFYHFCKSDIKITILYLVIVKYLLIKVGINKIYTLKLNIKFKELLIWKSYKENIFVITKKTNNGLI